MNKKKQITLFAILIIFIVMIGAIIKAPTLDESKNSVVETKKSIIPPQEEHSLSADLQVIQRMPVLKIKNHEVQKSSEAWEQQFFNQYLKITMDKIPTKKELQKLPQEETHHNPTVVMEIGLRLGKIKKQIKLNQDFAPEAMSFYQDCARLEGSMTPVRSLCLANLIYLKKEKGEEIDLSSYPTPVRELAKKALELSF